MRIREQHVAVFGGSGSGKTVLASSFYGAAQERSFLKGSLFHVIADDTGQGNRLRQNYLGMKNSAKAPEPTRFAATPYRFTIKPKARSDPKTERAHAFDALRLVWHDYPGEWFEEEPSSAEEDRRRIETFRLLLRSDVAIILVDGQKLADYVGEEEKYLKSMLGNICDGLLRLKDELLDDGRGLEQFPRIWMVALSKADLHQDLDVHGFQDLIVEKAAGDLAALQEVIRGLVELPDALSVGDDFLLLSSARFAPGKIEVEQRVGLDLLLPVALILPLERVVDWMGRLEIPRRWLDRLADNADAFATVIVGARLFRRALGKVPKVGPVLTTFALPALTAALKLGGAQVKQLNADARAKHDYLTAILTQFKLDLDQGQEDDLLATRPR
jgi:hypothetical protein